jgi:molybdopterin-biosynthesis enzyme MoeA-like protein
VIHACASATTGAPGVVVELSWAAARMPGFPETLVWLWEHLELTSHESHSRDSMAFMCCQPNTARPQSMQGPMIDKAPHLHCEPRKGAVRQVQYTAHHIGAAAPLATW